MTPTPSKVDQSRKRPKKFAPAHGRDIELTLSAMDQYETSRTRDNLAYVLVGSAILSVIVAAGYGLYTGSFGGLRYVWDVVGPIMGGITVYYFGRSRKD